MAIFATEKKMLERLIYSPEPLKTMRTKIGTEKCQLLQNGGFRKMLCFENVHKDLWLAVVMCVIEYLEQVK